MFRAPLNIKLVTPLTHKTMLGVTLPDKFFKVKADSSHILLFSQAILLWKDQQNGHGWHDKTAYRWQLVYMPSKSTMR